MLRSVLAVMSLSGVCMTSGCAEYNVSRAVYEGIQTRDQLQATPAERAAKPDMSYQQYDSERKSR